jgi:hypothetical protein
MFVSVAGWMLGGAGLPVATPMVLCAGGLALVLGVGVAGCALALARAVAQAVVR